MRGEGNCCVSDVGCQLSTFLNYVQGKNEVKNTSQMLPAQKFDSFNSTDYWIKSSKWLSEEHSRKTT
jgi:hypothetical protein